MENWVFTDNCEESVVEQNAKMYSELLWLMFRLWAALEYNICRQ
jgi:hypothetical protein